MPTAVENILSVYFVGNTVRPELQSILSNLLDEFGSNFQIISVNGQWINFEVRGMTGDVLFDKIDRRSGELFGRELANFQILRPLNDSRVRGVFLQHLHSAQLRETYRAGVWNY